MLKSKNFKFFFFFKKDSINLQFFKVILRSKSFNFNLNDLFKNLIVKLNRIQWQVKYLLSNWVYSTNHKRISINYFWFVLLAGIVGMVLATIIRVEMAYPGVGILAGDNSQYLSIVTAHGVIMVFFMAMPLLFGFFTNFLLPTQLGVHDVAFPRMNSAAFWFLPASLIILCQLVCVDRRYQRMNCFNVRELQSLVRRRFFYELNDSNVFNSTLSHTMVGSKFKSGNLNKSNTDNTILLGLKKNSSYNTKLSQFNQFLSDTENISSIWYEKLISPYLISFFSKTLLFINQSRIYFSYIANLLFTNNGRKAPAPTLSKSNLPNQLDSSPLLNGGILGNVDNPVYFFLERYYYSFQNLTNIPLFITLFINQLDLNSLSFKNIYFLVIEENFNYKGLLRTLFSLPYFSFSFSKNKLKLSSSYGLENRTFYNLSENSLESKEFSLKNNYIEDYSTARYLQHQMPSTVYKVKMGNYLPDVPASTNFNHLFNSFNEKTISERKPTWFNSHFVLTELSKNSNSSESNYTGHTDVFFIFSKILNKSALNLKYNSTSYFNQKFVNLFLSQSKQSNSLNNWKNLKLTREGWRCRMLMSRNQNSLYNRHAGEKNLIWVVEKNAKDLLPGWAMITPFSSRTRYTLVGKTDIGVMVVMITLIASLVSCSNFLITYRYLSTLNNRKMRDARSFFVESIIATCWMTLAANPMLVLGLFMLMCDRHWKTSFFDYSGGGDVVLFQHMFWFFGHPEVYIIIVPCFGLVNTMLSFYLRKRISARASLMYSMYTIAFLGFFVWGHHMYMVGLAHTTRMLYSTLTVMISVPAATKIMHWLVTFINSSLHFELPLFFVVAFIFFFLSGGISGMSVAHTGMDVLFHDTFFVIGHFHVMLAGSLMFAGFGACYFYLPAIFGVRYNRFFAYLHFLYYVVGQLFTVIPMIWLGYAGMPRRVLDYPAAMGGWHSLSTSAHILSIAGILCFIFMLFDSLRKKKPYIIKSFGIGRYNTRLNFYVYEINRSRYWQFKVNSLYREDFTNSSLSNIHNSNSTLFFYHLKN